MERIIVTYAQDGMITRIQADSQYPGKTKEELYAAMNLQNSKHPYKVFDIFEVPSELSECLNFLMGEEGYRSYADMENLYWAVKSLKDEQKTIEESFSQLTESINECVSDVKQLMPASVLEKVELLDEKTS